MDKKFKFTNANIKNLPAPTKRTFVYDTIEVGLSLQITPNGAKSFYYRGVVLGKQIRVKLGEPSYMSVDDARQAARKAKINMKEGINPIEERKKITGESSLEQLYTRFMDEKEQHIRPITMEYYKDLWKRYLSTLANKKISQITPDELKIKPLRKVMFSAVFNSTMLSLELRPLSLVGTLVLLVFLKIQSLEICFG